MISIADAMADPVLFEPWFSGPSWNAWWIVLRGAYGLPLSEAERETFRQLAERDPPRSACANFGAFVADERARTASHR